MQASWSDCGHLSDEAKADLLASIPAYQRDARSKGIPALGSGAIYPVPEADYVVQDFEIPDHWPRCFGMDIGWRITAVCWAALNRDTDALYIYAEHYRGEAEPVVHAEAIKARGRWIKGAIDPAARGRGQTDGRNLLDMYRDLGLDLLPAENSVETGLYEVLTRLSSGRLKIFKSCQNLLREMRLYRRDEKGRVVKENDHECDSLRYLCMELHNILTSKHKAPIEDTDLRYSGRSYESTGWMG